jgi:hypothetical protein
MPKFEANDSKGQNDTAFHRVLSEVFERHTHLEVSSQMCWDLMAFNEP